MLKAFELKLAARLLDMAGDKFGNHGCNDFNLIDEGFGFSDQELIDLDRKMHEQNGDPEEHDPEWAVTGHQADSCLMFYLSHRFEAEAKDKCVTIIRPGGDRIPTKPGAADEATFDKIKSRVDAMGGGRVLPQCQVDWTEAEQDFVSHALIDITRLLGVMPALGILNDSIVSREEVVTALCSALGITREDAERLVKK